MKLRYINLDALTNDIQIPAIQIEPMIYGNVYDVDESFLQSGHWERAEIVEPVVEEDVIEKPSRPKASRIKES